MIVGNHSVFQDAIAYQNAERCKFSELRWSVTDLATTQGVLLVERLRTANGKIVSLDDHIQRLHQSASLVGIDSRSLLPTWSEHCKRVIDENRQLVDDLCDVSIVMLLSPGDPGLEHRSDILPNWKIHIAPIPFRQLHGWYQRGSSLFASTVRNVPKECWSPWIKTRSRLQYHLADRQATRLNYQNRNERESDPPNIAVLLAPSGIITETSVANLLVIDREGTLLSPKSEDILQGVSQSTVVRLANAMGWNFVQRDLYSSDLDTAKEILLAGTTGFLWSCISWNQQIVGEGVPGECCKTLQERWIGSIGFNFIDQAIAQSAQKFAV